MERELAQARDRERAASEAKESVAATLAAKETELLELASLEAAAKEEAERLRAAESSLVAKAETLTETLVREQSLPSRRDAEVLREHRAALAAKEEEMAKLRALRDDAEAGEKKWREASENAERLAREASATSRDAETREKTLGSEMARLATEAGARRGELEAERARVEALEEKVRLLGEARASEEASLTARASAREADAAEKLESMRSALALAEAKMVRMARDLAEAEEELEQRDAAEASRLEGLTMGLTMATSRMRVAAPETATADQSDATISAETHVSSAPALEIQRERALVPRSEHDIFSKVRNNRHGEVETLLSSGAVSPDFRDRNGNTVLMVAAQNNRKRLVKACVRHGVPLDARNLKGNTAMHFAKAYGYEDVAEYLVRKGADPTIVNREGLRPDQGLTAATTKVGGDVATTLDDERTNA
jgi:hypothetical protein